VSGGYPCKCQHPKPGGTPRTNAPFLDWIRAHWRVLQYLCNHSAFNGGHRTPSDYSSVRCTKCGSVWRTKARYVHGLREAKHGPQ
jgi:hypothetical protein